MSDWTPYEQKIGPDGSPSQETRAFHSRDAELRKAGFAIYSRTKGQPPVWERNGRLFPQALAIELAEREANKGPL